MKKKNLLLLLILLTTVLIVPLFGATDTGWSALWPDANPEARYVFIHLRLMRLLVGLLAGGLLSLCGLGYQTLFRNDLASPYTLGVASGAALGASIWLRFGWGAGLSLYLAGIAGAALITLILILLDRMGMLRDLASLLLTGVALGYLASSMLLLVQFSADYTASFQIVHWLMGGINDYGRWSAVGLLLVLALALLCYRRWLPELELMRLGSELAEARGVDVRRFSRHLILLNALIVGAVVSRCGPIGFVGLMVPHICRGWLGGSLRALLPAVTVGGGVFLAWSDLLARTVYQPLELPVGILTTGFGAIFFFGLLLRRTRQRM